MPPRGALRPDPPPSIVIIYRKTKTGEFEDRIEGPHTIPPRCASNRHVREKQSTVLALAGTSVCKLLRTSGDGEGDRER
jgi:hypothetical protein